MARPPQILITRPAADSRELAERLTALGMRPVMAPLLDIVLFGPEAPGFVPQDLESAQALAFTSANGVRALVRATGKESLPSCPVFAVGDATARAARDAGFSSVESADGDVRALESLIASSCAPGRGPIWHVAGTKRAGDLAARLEARGFSVRRAVLYDARPVDRLDPAVLDALEKGDISAVMIFSPRTARQFVRLLDGAGKTTAAATTRLVALSSAVAAAAGALPWGGMVVAARPNMGSMINVLRDAVDAAQTGRRP